MPDGGVEFTVKLNNQVTGPAKAAKSAMAGLKRQIESTRSAIEAPAPKRAATSDWDRMVGNARRSQASDNARQQARIVKLNAADQAKAQKLATKNAKISEAKALKEQKRVADFKLGINQQKLDNKAEFADMAGGVAKFGGLAIAGAAMVAAAAVGYLAVKFSEAAVEAAAFGERSRKALGLLTDSAGTGALQFDSLRKEAAGLGLDIQSTQLSFQKLLAAQFDISKSRELIRMGSDLQAIGADAEDVKGVLLAITQIKSKGKLQAEEMLQLQERGISAELVYSALGEKMGKSKDELMALQKKGQLGGPEAIDAILAAVRKKTNTEFAGQAGEQFAATTLTGMLNVWKARGTNMMIDIGDAILPGVTRLAKLITGGIDSIMNDPAIQNIGRFLLSEFEYFTLWVEADWPQVSGSLRNGLELFADSIRFTVELFDTGTTKGKIFAGIMLSIAAVFAVVALAGFTLMAPLYLLIAVIGLVAYGIYKAVQWIVEAFNKLPSWSTAAIGLSSLAMPGVGFMGGMPGGATSGGVETAADVGPTASLGRTLGSFNPADVITVQGEPQNQVAAGPHFDFSGMQVGANVDQNELVAKIRSEVTKALEEA